MMKDNTVIVLDTSNYKSSYGEEVPFKAVVEDKDELNIIVISITTRKRYELYSHQILESMDLEDIKQLINLEDYGKSKRTD
jgi:hypothetical protein